MQIFQNANYDFIRWRWHGLILSSAVIIAGFVLSLVRGGFLGLGSKETLRFSRYSEAFADFHEAEKIYRRNVKDLEDLRHAA